MIQLTDKSCCCGCEACAQICPRNCISMVEDVEGFLYPAVNYKQCVGCDLCEKVCPVIQEKKMKSSQQPQTFVAKAKSDTVRMTSSSGGIFTLIAESIIEENGVVFGAGYDDTMRVHHVAVETSNDLKRVRGSKYVQSAIEDTFQKAEAFLKEGKKVLFSGTPCQIAGLKGYLRKEYENLYTVDILCHGVPSPKLWKQYIEEQSSATGEKVKNAYFRSKKTGWKMFSMELLFSDGTSYCKNKTEDSYLRLFLANACLRPSCHNCKYKTVERISDITLGDCWGVEGYMADMDDDSGTSVVLVNTERGKFLLHSISSHIVCREAELDLAIPVDAGSRVQLRAHPKRTELFEMLENKRSVSEIVRILHIPFIKRLFRKIKRIINQ